jgi:hypothetical protein
MRAVAAIAALAFSWAVADAAWSYEPAVNYQLHCMGCHLADGSGQPGRVPSMRRSLLLLSGMPAGREFVIRVPGVAQSPLSSEETAALLNWMVRNLSDLQVPAGFADYSAAEVRSLRDRPLVRVSALRSRLLRAAAVTPLP